MRVLLITEFFPKNPERDVFGVHQRQRMLVGAAAAFGELEVLFYVSEEVDRSALARSRWERTLSEHWDVNVRVAFCPRLSFPLRLPKHKLLALIARSIRDGSFSFFTQKLSLQTSGNDQVRGLDDSLDRRPDLIIAHRLGAMAPLVRTRRPLPPIVFDLDDVEHVKHRRMVKGTPDFRSRLRFVLTSPLLRRAEARAIAKAARTLVCSDVDRRELEKAFSVHTVTVVPNGVALPPQAVAGSEPAVLFLGNFRYGPNADGATYLVRDIWPRIRREVPEAKLLLAGAHEDRLPEDVRTAAGVEALGFVQDLAALYSRTQVVACPLRIASGLRIKILEAAAWGKPVVATTTAAEGIEMTSEQEFVLDDDPGLFADACVELLRDPSRRRLMGEQARAAVQRLYDRRRIVGELTHHLRAVTSPEPPATALTSSPMRTGRPIVLVGGTSEPGGVHVHTAALARGLAAGGHPVTILSTEADYFSQLLGDAPIDVRRVELPAEGLRAFFAWRKALLPFAGAQGIYCRDFGGAGSLEMLLAMWSRFSSLDTIEHSLPAVDALRTSPGWRDRWAARLVHRSYAVSDQVRDHLVETLGYAPERVHTCYNWVDAGQFSPGPDDRRRMRAEYDIPDDCFVVGYAGRLGSEKRVDLLIRGFARFASSAKRDARLVIVGGGWLEAELRALVDSLDLSERVTFAGWADDVARWYRAFDLFVLCSLYEGFPLTLLEAMACGTPCLSHFAGGSRGGARAVYPPRRERVSRRARRPRRARRVAGAHREPLRIPPGRGWAGRAGDRHRGVRTRPASRGSSQTSGRSRGGRRRPRRRAFDHGAHVCLPSAERVMSARVAIVLPTYNRAHCLPRAIGSALEQTFPNWELFVVDDHSTDGTADLVEELAQRDPRVRSLRNARRRGAAGARNTALHVCDSELVAFLDSDDRWERHHLEVITHFLETHLEVDLACADALRIDHTVGERQTASAFQCELLEYWRDAPGGEELFGTLDPGQDPSSLAQRDHILSFVIGGFVWIQTPAVVVRRAALDRWGFFDESLPRTEDYDLWLRLNGSGRIGFVPEVTAEVDVSGQDTMEGRRYESYEATRRTSAWEETHQHLAILRSIVDDGHRRSRGWGDELSRDQRRFARAQMNMNQRELGFLSRRQNWGRAAWHYLQAIRYRPRDVLYLATKPREYFAEP